MAAYRFQRWYRRLNENHTKNTLGCHASFPSVPRDTSPPARSKKLSRRVRGRAGVVPSVIRLVRIGLFFLDDICSLHLCSLPDRPFNSLLSHEMRSSRITSLSHCLLAGKLANWQFGNGYGSTLYGSFHSTESGISLRLVSTQHNRRQGILRRPVPFRACVIAGSVRLPRGMCHAQRTTCDSLNLYCGASFWCAFSVNSSLLTGG